MTKPILVIGSYKCGCTYGPIRKSQRLEYCGIHGENIQNEYQVPETLESNSNKEISNG